MIMALMSNFDTIATDYGKWAAKWRESNEFESVKTIISERGPISKVVFFGFANLEASTNWLAAVMSIIHGTGKHSLFMPHPLLIMFFRY